MSLWLVMAARSKIIEEGAKKEMKRGVFLSSYSLFLFASLPSSAARYAAALPFIVPK